MKYVLIAIACCDPKIARTALDFLNGRYFCTCEMTAIAHNNYAEAEDIIDDAFNYHGRAVVSGIINSQQAAWIRARNGHVIHIAHEQSTCHCKQIPRAADDLVLDARCSETSLQAQLYALTEKLSGNTKGP